MLLPRERRVAALALATLGELALPKLRELLASSRTRPTARILVRRLPLAVLERLWLGPEARPPAAAYAMLGRALARHPVEGLASVQGLAARPGALGRTLVLHALAARGGKARALIESLLEAGAGVRVSERVAWLRAVARAAPEHSSDLLIEALDDADPAIRLCAEAELVRMGQQVVQKLRRCIEQSPSRRLARVVRERPVGESVEVSLARAAEAKQSARLHAARALARLPGAVQAVRPWLRLGDQELRACALFVLGSLGSAAQSEAERVAAFVSAEDAGLARLAIWAMGELGLAEQALLDCLRPSLQSPSPLLRAAAVEAISRSAGAAVRSLLAGALVDDDDRVVAAAMKGLARVAPGDSRLPAAIVRRLSSEGSALRPSVRRVFARQSDVALEPYLRYFREGDEAERLGALRAVEIAVDLDPGKIGELVDFLKAAKEPSREAVLGIVLRMGPRAVPAIRELRSLLAERGAPRLDALRAIAAIGPAAAPLRPDVERHLAGADPETSRAIKKALARLDPYEGRRAVVATAIASAAPAARVAAIRRVGELGDSSFESEIVAALADDLPMIRLAACDALARLRPKAAASARALIECFRDPIPAVRIRASFALSRMRSAALPSLIAALDEDELEVRRFATITLERLGSAASEAREKLEAMLFDPDESLRQSANLALDAIGER